MLRILIVSDYVTPLSFNYAVSWCSGKVNFIKLTLASYPH